MGTVFFINLTPFYQDMKPSSHLHFQDQHHLIDSNVRDHLIAAAHLDPDDVVLEIGAGTGYITKELSKHCKKVISVEVDPRFKPYLCSLPNNVDVRYGNILGLITRISFTKLVSNLPFSITEPLLKQLLKSKLETAALLVGSHFFSLLSSDSKWSIITPLFFTVNKLEDVPKHAYQPQPRVQTVLLTLENQVRPLTIPERILKELVLQDDKKLKNALTNSIKITMGVPKLQAKKTAESLGIPAAFFAKRVDHLSNRQFGIVCATIAATPLFK